MLSDKTIHLLMQCVDNLGELERKIFDGFDWKTKIEKEFASIQNDKFLSECLEINDVISNIDKKTTIEIILSQMKKIRLAAVSAIYNCVKRDKTILNKQRLAHIENCKVDDDNEFKKYKVIILGSFDNGKDIDYKKLFNECLEQIEKDGDIEQPIKYIDDQSKDEKRCKELFNEYTITKISKLFVKDKLSETMKTYACAIINNYLERSYTSALNEIQLRDYSNLIDNSKYDENLKIEALKSIILSIEKNKDLPEFMTETLIKNINKGNDKLDNFIILIIRILSEEKKIENVDILSTKLLEDWIIVRDGIDISFEKSSEENNYGHSISSMVAQIFVNCLQKNTRINDKSFENLVKALNSNDKQTCILSAKSLYLASKTHNIKNDILVTLREHVDNSIPDVSIYSTVAYAQGLAKLSSVKEPIMKSHIEFLSNIYVFEELQLGEEYFTDVVNKNILSILKNEAANQLFEEDIFQIFDHILLFENHYMQETIEILIIYSANKYPIQDSTIFALENVASTPELSNQILQLFENIVYKKQVIGEKILRIIADNFYLSDKDEFRDQSFYILNMANDNQDISDELFDILELERASLAISQCLLDANDSIIYLCEKTKEGQKITINGFRALSKVIFHKQFILNEDILRILLNVSKNGQMIPNNLIDKLVKRFDPKLAQSYLIEIFENLVKNNQNISEEFSSKLTIALDNSIIVDQVLFIFLLQGQKGKNLSEKIIRKILDKFLAIENPSTMQHYLPVICSVIEKEDYFKRHTQNLSNEIVDNNFDTIIIPAVNRALIHALKTDNQDVIHKSISGLKTLRSLHQIELEKGSIEILLQIAANVNYDASIKEEISELLSGYKLEGNQKTVYEQAYMICDSDGEFLDKLASFDKLKLFKQNFDRISSIIEKSSELKFQALNILLNCSNKKNIPDKLLDSIALLLESTNSLRIKSKCCQLIKEIAETGGTVTYKIISVILDQDEQEKPIDILKLISKNQTIPEELQNKIKLFSDIASMTDISFRALSEFLKNIREEFNKNKTFSDLSIRNLLSLKISKNDIQNDSELEKELNDIYALVLIQDPNYSSNQTIVDSLEKAIISTMINENILNAYKEIIKQTRCQTNNFSKVFDAFIDILNQDKNYTEFNFDILVCIALASESTQISELKHLENNLSNDNEMIRSWSFRGLRAAHEKGSYSSIFKECCDNIINTLEENTKIIIDIDLDLFETIASLKFIDFNKIRDKPKDQWNRELLIFDLIERFQISEGECFQFYQAWLHIEEHEGYEKGQSNILLKLLHRFLVYNRISFDECYQIIKIVKQLSFESVHNILLNSKNPLIDLNKKYLIVIITQRLRNKDEISPEYIEGSASSMILKLGFDISQKLLDALHNIDNLTEFDYIVAFSQKNNIKISDIYVKNATISKLKRSLEIKFLGHQIVRTDRLKLAHHIDTLLDRNWKFEELNDLFKIFKESNNQNKTRYFMNVLEILSHYKIPRKDKEKLLLALKNPVENWQREINKIAIENNFPDKSKEKNSKDLIDELKTQNSLNQNLKHLTEKTLLEWIEKIKNQSSISSLLDEKDENRFPLVNQNSITQWTKVDIQNWAKKVKANVETFKNKKDFIIEALAVIKQATYLDTDFHLNDAQILSCLIALNLNNNQGRLLQVATGEGKSTIISVLAIFYALTGKTVDIITSSPVLAERDAKEKAKFYNMFGLGCSHNNDKLVYVKGLKTCYKKEIVYGEAAQFQFDILRTEYAQLNTLGDRKCEVAIVDEVDSMLIDDSSKIARLATTVSGMDQLQIIYHLLWNQLVTLQEKIIAVDNKLYLFYGKIEFKKEKIILEYANEQGDIVSISDSKSYLTLTSDISDIGFCIPEYNEFDVVIKKHLKDYIISFIEKNIRIPKNFKDFVDTQIPKWIENCITAYTYQENVHYIVHEGLIKPVDYYSTGIVQSSSNWSDGLHQFLQIKHNLKMTSETFTTNFLSNRGYFTKYGSNLFGFTGTLGSEKAKQVLAEVYNLDFVMIPSLRRKQHLSLPDIVVDNEIYWLEEICHSAINESRKERGTLIICETIEHCKIIAETIQQEYRSSTIKLYTMNDMNQEENIKIINPREIIIATNLAGRGTDIKTDEIEEHGGLHVIVTFMPSNQRVEEQAFGRTSRQGKRGTSQKILNAIDLIHYQDLDIKNITQERDRIEANMLNDFEQNELEVIRLKDELFVKFCSLLKEIRKKIRENNSLVKNVKNAVKSALVNVNPSIFESNVLLSIEEQWAMFLRQIDDEKSNFKYEKIHDDYEKFSKKIIDDYENNCVIKNPYYHIIIGNDLVINDSSLNSKYDEAMKHFERAIELDPDHCAAAFVGRGWLLLKGKEKIVVSNKQCLNYKDTAIRSFQRALELLSEEMTLLTSMQALSQQRCTNIDTPLFKQLIQKSNILGTYCNHLENLISITRKSQRLIQITEIIDYSESIGNITNTGILKKIVSYNKIEKGIGKWCNIRLVTSEHVHRHKNAIENCKEIAIVKDDETEFRVIYKQKDEEKLGAWVVNDSKINESLSNLVYDDGILDRSNYSTIYDQIYKEVSSKNGFMRADFLVPLQNLPKNRKYEVTFNDFTTREDCGTRDQAIETINRAIAKSDIINSSSSRTKSILNSEYQYINVSIYQINSEIMQDLFNPDIEILEVTKQKALTQLKDKSSFFHRHLFPDSISPDSYKVNLDVIQDNNKIRQEKDLQVRDVIEIIEKQDFVIEKEKGVINKQEKDNLHYNLTFIAANKKISEVIKNRILNHAKLTVEFVDLDGQEVLNKVTEISSTSITLEIFDGKEQLLEVISEKHFVPWFSIATVAGLAAVQMTVGGILVATGFGSTVGMGLITEGVADLVIAFRVYSTRQFSWSDYGKQKAVSLIISAVSMGISAIKDAGKGAKTLVTAAGKELAEQAGTKAIMSGNAAGQELVKRQGIVELNNELANQNFLTQLKAIHFPGFDIHKDNIVNFLIPLHTTMSKLDINDFSEIMKLVSDTITDQVLRITQSQLISPWSNYGMSELTKAISEKIQYNLIDDEKQNSDSQNQQKEEKTCNIIAKKIQYNARDYIIAYSQCEMIHYAQQKHKTNHQKIDENVKAYASSVRMDIPANMSDMFTLANEYRLDLKIVDDPNYQITKEDKTR
ncbi:unnamed protein product, partial [Rotaria sordida]